MVPRPILLVAVILSAVPAQAAMDPENADPSLAPWFQQLKQPGTEASCCSIADCRQVEYRSSGDHYEVFIRGAWTEVPNDKVLKNQSNPTGHGVACYTEWQGVMCFVPASGA